MKRAGFTLIEFIAIISLIMVIASIAVPNYSRIVDENRLKADAATALEIAKLSETYYAQHRGSFSNDQLRSYLLKAYDGEMPKPQYDPSADFDWSIDSIGRATVRMTTKQLGGGNLVLVDRGKIKEPDLESLTGKE